MRSCMHDVATSQLHVSAATELQHHEPRLAQSFFQCKTPPHNEAHRVSTTGAAVPTRVSCGRDSDSGRRVSNRTSLLHQEYLGTDALPDKHERRDFWGSRDFG